MIDPELEDDKKKYNSLEPIFQKIMKSIALPNDIIQRNVSAISEILEFIIGKMLSLDIMFNEMFQKIFYGGSFYDGLKVRNPDEFDMDLVMVLPKLTNPILETSEIAGFIKVKLSNYGYFKMDKNFQMFYSKMDKFVDSNGYLLRGKFFYWFESLIIRAQNEIKKDVTSKYNFTVRKSGPALTLIVDIEGDFVHVDLVPSFTFSEDKWPSYPFRMNPVRDRKDFLIVPKAPKNSGNDLYWRLSFQEQERMLLHDKNRLKDCLKLLKLLRDEQKQERIASYFLKTVILWMNEKVDSNFWSSNSLSYTFMMALKYYNTLLLSEQIDYYWNPNNNLLGYERNITLRQWSQRLKRITTDIEKNLNSPSDLEKNVCGYFGLHPAQIQEDSGSWCVIS